MIALAMFRSCPLPGAIVLRANEFSQPDYDVIYKDPDGRELGVGRIFRNDGMAGRPWFWGLEFHQAQGRATPYYGQGETLEAAKAAWRQCWDSADTLHWPAWMSEPGPAPGGTEQ